MIHRERFSSLQDFAMLIVEQLDVSPTKTRVAVVYWATQAALAFNLNSYTNKHDVQQAIKLETRFTGGGSNISDALEIIRQAVFTPQNGDRPNAKNIVLLIANGPSTLEKPRTIPEAIQLRLAGVQLIPVALEAHMNSSIEMWSMASNPKLSNLLKISFFKELPNEVPIVLNAMCNGVAPQIQSIAL